MGTPGYVANEQLGGKPRVSSDIYALGITAIQALTRLYPEQIAENTQTGEILWRQNAQVSDRLAGILDLMVKSHFRDRYQSVEEVLNDLQNIQVNSQNTLVSNTTKNQLPTTNFAPLQQLSTIDNRSESLKHKPISLPLVVGLIATTAVATLYLSRLLLPRQQVVNSSVGITPLVPNSTPQPAVVRSPVATPGFPASSNPTVVRSPLVQVTQSNPRVSPPPNTASLPEISSPTVTTKINPQVQIASPKLTSAPVARVTEPIPLTEVKCSTTSADSNSQSFVESLKNLTIGKATVTAIAELASQNSNNPANSQIKADTPAGVDCLLNPRNGNNQFNTLKLAFGINDTNKYLSNVSAETKVRLTVYLDRKNIGSKEVTKGEIKTWGLNIAEVENVALEAECIESNYVPKICPALVFTQVDLN